METLQALRRKWPVKKIVFYAVVVIGIVIYKMYNPSEDGRFPKCIFRSVTGYKCAGCGSQRAIHHLLNLEIGAALRENILMVLSIPYLVLGFILESMEQPGEKWLKWRKRLYGPRAILTVLIIVVIYWILRNIPYCAQHCYL